ncbi:MAG: ROK family transcriptional regulator, partial [Ktedonobacterales bacterium]|nr:ROK family transcriptional regulator [Ktedonobacterales bacterium]
MLMVRDGPAIPGNLRQHNRLTILRYLRRAGPMTKPALAQATGISRPTVTKVVDDLDREGLVEAVGMATPGQGGGKPGMRYRFRASGIRSGALFLRVDTLYVAIIDGNARILARADYPLGDAREPEAIIALMVTALTTLLAQMQLTTSDILGVGVGVPGVTSYHTGIVHLAPHLPEWREVPLGASLAERLQTAVWVDNDCHVQALAERHFGGGQDVRNFVSVQSGIGLSAGLFLAGALFRGAFNTAGEMGHMIVQEDGPLCHCGKRGCWETLASTERLVMDAWGATTGAVRPPAWIAELHGIA